MWSFDISLSSRLDFSHSRRLDISVSSRLDFNHARRLARDRSMLV